jgi:hypothetical protein
LLIDRIDLNIGDLYIWTDTPWIFKVNLKRQFVYLGFINFDWSKEEDPQ